jgi:hypothetical protein
VVRGSGHALLFVTTLAFIFFLGASAWLVLKCTPPILAHLYGVSEVCYGSHPQSSDEDLRASFQIEGMKPNNLEVKYLLRNLGKQTALVSGIGLFEIVATKGLDDPQNTVNLCDDVAPETLLSLQMANQIMGEGAQVGGDTKRNGEYAAITLLVDGAPWDPKTPIPIEGDKIRLVSAAFVTNPDHTKHFNALVLCPMLGTIDIRNIHQTAICRGMSVTVAGTQRVESHSMQQFRILPHPPGVSCPVAAQ